MTRSLFQHILSLYGSRSDINKEELFNGFVDIANKCNIPLGSTELQIIDQKKSRTPAIKVLSEIVKAAPLKVGSFSVYSPKKDFVQYGYSRLACNANFGERNLITVGVCENLLRSRDEFIECVLPIIFMSCPKYGFISSIPAGYPVNFYAAGIIYNPPTSVSMERLEILHEAFSFSYDLIRDRIVDVYETTIVGSNHLQRRFGEHTLKEWIDIKRLGNLSHLGGNLWLLNIPSHVLREARRELAMIGAIDIPSKG